MICLFEIYSGFRKEEKTVARNHFITGRCLQLPKLGSALLLNLCLRRKYFNSDSFDVIDCVKGLPIYYILDILPECTEYAVFLSLKDGLKYDKRFTSLSFINFSTWRI